MVGCKWGDGGGASFVLFGRIKCRSVETMTVGIGVSTSGRRHGKKLVKVDVG